MLILVIIKCLDATKKNKYFKSINKIYLNVYRRRIAK